MGNGFILYLIVFMRVATILLFIATLVIALTAYDRWPAYRSAYLPVSIWSFMGMVFYLLVLSQRFSEDILEIIETCYQLLSVFLVFGAALSAVAILHNFNSTDDDE